jgi:hypothetical protein
MRLFIGCCAHNYDHSHDALAGTPFDDRDRPELMQQWNGKTKLLMRVLTLFERVDGFENEISQDVHIWAARRVGVAVMSWWR